MQNREEDGAFHREAEGTTGQELADDILAAGLLPQAFKDKSRADALSGEDRCLAVAVGGEQEDVFGKACSGGEQRIELAGLLELVESAEGGEDALADAAVGAGVFDDLQVLTGTGLFDAEEYGGLRAGMRTPRS